MGGKAIKQAHRMSRDDYFQNMDVLRKIFDANKIEFAIPPVFATKTTFGDMDIVTTDVDSCIAALRGRTDAKIVQVNPKNGDVVSIGVVFPDSDSDSTLDSDKTVEFKSVVQVDVIGTHSSLLELASWYMSFGWFGMVVGMCLKRCGMTYGSRGLFLDSDDVKLKLATDHAAIMEFVGIRGLDAVETPEDLVRVLAASRLDLEVVCARLEKTLDGDLDRLVPFKALFFEHATPKNDRTAIRADEAIDRFGKRAEYEDAVQKTRDREAVKAKFNGRIVADVTNLAGSDLGKFMKHLLDDSAQRGFRTSDLLDADADAIRQKIAEAYRSYESPTTA